MRGLLRISFWMLLCSIGTGSLWAQENWQKVNMEEVVNALTLVNEKIVQAKTLKVQIDQEIIDLTDSSTYMKSKGFFARKDSLLFRSKSFGVEIMQNEDCRVVIDSNAKTLVVSNIGATAPAFDPVTIQSYFSKYPKTTAYRSVNEAGETSYLIRFEGEDLPVQALSFSYTSDLLLAEVLIDLNQSVNPEIPDAKCRTVMRFSNYTINKSIPKAYFSADFAVKKKKGKFQPAPEYTGFEFINTYR